MVKFLLIMLLATLQAAVSLGAKPTIQIYVSPDGAMEVKVIPIGEMGWESRIEIRNAQGEVIRRKAFASLDEQHGECVGHAAWTPDSQFFVFNTFSSGGHQPWHVPTYFYIRAENRIRFLDVIVGSIITDFTLEVPHTLKARVLHGDFGANKGLPLNVDLSRFERRHK